MGHLEKYACAIGISLLEDLSRSARMPKEDKTDANSWGAITSRLVLVQLLPEAAV
jgi:hypothetical protein